MRREEKRGIESPCREMTCGTFRTVRPVLSAPAGVGSRFFLYLPEKKEYSQGKNEGTRKHMSFPCRDKMKGQMTSSTWNSLRILPIGTKVCTRATNFPGDGFLPNEHQ
jgi:hypothetical protein